MSSLNYKVLILLFCWLLLEVELIGVSPVWLTSPYVQADTKSIITTKTGNSSTPTATLTFPNAFSNLPNIGYGIDGYEGDDFLGQQSFEVNRTGLTSSSFSVLVQIQGVTNIWLMKVRYIAIDRAFPHKLNSFDNVPINYLNGALTNITVNSSSLTYYSNTINFTAQSIASGQNFIEFLTPLTDNKILLFMTSLQMDGSLESSFYFPWSSSGTDNPLNLQVFTTILSNQTYNINFTCSALLVVSKVHFSMIIFNEADVISSGRYQLVYEKINLPGTGGFIPIPQEFQKNLIMGLVQLQTSKTKTVIHYDLIFTTDSSGTYGINMPQTTPRNSSVYAIRYGFTLFYMKTWQCPLYTFFDLSTDLCQSCSIPNCNQCISPTQCLICDSSLNYFLDPMKTCAICSLSNCLTCSSLTACSVCDNSNGFFLDPVTKTCGACSLLGCITCLNDTACTTCDNANGHFLNSATGTCGPCPLAGCITCFNDTACSLCDSSNNYFLESTTGTCVSCSLLGCTTCLNLTACSLCDNTNNYFLDSSTATCILCSFPNCMTCSSLTVCVVCNPNYFMSSLGQCLMNQQTNICGDGVYSVPQGCDDGNLVDGDGCSSTCTVQTNYTCEPNPNPTPNNLNSVCFYVGEITINVVYIEKIDNANQLEILLEIGPKDANFWKDVDFTKMVTLSNMTGFQNYTVKMNSDGTVSLIANYNSTIQNMNITVQLDPAQSGKTELSRYPPVSKQFEMIPTDNELAVFYDGSVYQIATITNILAYAISCAALFLFIIGIFADKLVGVEMMAVVQISHLSLITLDNLNPVFKALANIWFVNGFNYFSMSKNYLLDSSTPIKVKGIYLFSYFFQNYNFTFLLIFVPLLLSLICLILSLKVFNLSKRKEIMKLGKRFVYEFAFTGLMLSGYIVSVSLALEIKYGFINVNELVPLLSIIKFVIMISLIVLYFVLKIVKPQHFGEFTDKFHIRKNIQLNQSTEITEEDGTCNGKTSRFHYNSLIIERIVVGTCLVFLMDFKLSLILPILVFVFFGIESIFLKPYKELKHNIRFLCNMAITITILIIYLCYNLTNQKNFGSQSNVWIYMPFLVCTLLFVCIIYSAVFLIKQLIRRYHQIPKKQQKSISDIEWITTQKYNLSYTPRQIQAQKKYILRHNDDWDKIKKEFKQIRKSILKQRSLHKPYQNKNIEGFDTKNWQI